MNKNLALSFVLLVAIAACAPRQAATTWGYSHWYDREGAGSLGTFEQAQRRCLDEVGAAGDPAGVAVDSPQEDAFFECMNRSHWCTQVYRCEKPDA